MSAQKETSRFKFLPFRPLGDFLLDPKRYQPPTFNDLKRFNNRVTSNLLYYQTNYIVVAAVVFSLFLLFGLGKMVSGAFGIATTVAVVLFTLDKIPQVSHLKAQYPIAVPALAVLDLIVVYITFRPILFVALATLLPIKMSIIHASMRTRGLKNKINNKMEQLGATVYANSPMGIVLSTLGLEAKDFDE